MDCPCCNRSSNLRPSMDFSACSLAPPPSFTLRSGCMKNSDFEKPTTGPTICLECLFLQWKGYFELSPVIPSRYADEVATSIGWPLNSGFQMELGFASIGIGLVGFLSFWNKSYWLPFIIMKFIFGWGAGYTHILHMIQQNNFSPSNTGNVVYWDFIFPVVMIVLYLLHQRQQKKN